MARQEDDARRGDAEGGEGVGDRAERAAREAGALVDDEEAAGVGAEAGGEAGREAEAALERVADGADGQRLGRHALGREPGGDDGGEARCRCCGCR